MELKKFIEIFEEKYPLSLAEEWDNVGLILGNNEDKINKILCCLDVTDLVIEKAIENKVDLIIAHHPMIFSPLKKITNENFLGNKILKLIKNNINLYIAHTNLDIAENGLNDFVLEKLNFDGKKITDDRFLDKAIRFFEFSKETNLEKIIEKIKMNLGINYVRFVHDNYYVKNKNIKKIALTTGSGDTYINDILGEVDLFITGDLKHHVSLDTLEKGMPLIDISHYGSEYLCVDLFEKIVKQIFNENNENIKIIVDYGFEVLKLS